jgi:hypothetical protein
MIPIADLPDSHCHPSRRIFPGSAVSPDLSEMIGQANLLTPSDIKILLN